MATAQQLGVTLGVGCSFLSVTLMLFGGAIRLRLTHIAPRCEARPRNVIYNPDPNRDPCQDRGNPFLLGWMFWSLKQSYHTLLRGVPGTGTREGGLKGHLLQTNLDMIVLLRFHALGLKIATFAMIIYCAIVLPTYLTAHCYNHPNDENPTSANCTDHKLTRYERLTLANVPPLMQTQIWGTTNHIVSFRLYVVVLCSYIVCWYTCYEIQQEWIDLLAMRRVYYLEYDHWKGRKEELKATTLHREESRRRGRDDDNPYMHNRESWIPHPEQRDTPPNISLYSVLVEGLPSRPRQVAQDEDIEAALYAEDDDQKLDWQLSVTAAFFDYCIPNQPGFSSSVAAVTILPSASELVKAWKKFYEACKKLSRLRFIRRELYERGYGLDSHDGSDQYSDEEEYEVPTNESPEKVKANDNDDYEVYMADASDRRRRYTEDVLGCITDEELEISFIQSLHMGPEQTAVYNKEMSRSLALCCPHGCCEEEILYASYEKLLRMEKMAKSACREAFREFEAARKDAALAQEKRAELQELNRKSSVVWFDEDDESSLETELQTTASSPSRRKRARNSAMMETKIFRSSKRDPRAAFSKGQPFRHSVESHPVESHPKSCVKQLQSFRSSAQIMTTTPTNPTNQSLSSYEDTCAIHVPSAAFSRNRNALLRRQDSEESFKTAASSISESNRPVVMNGAARMNAVSLLEETSEQPAMPATRLLDERRDSSTFFNMLKPSLASGMVMNPDPFGANKHSNEHDASSHAATKNLDPWEIVELVATEAEASASRTGILKRDHQVSDGVWHRPTFGRIRKRFERKIKSILTWGLSATEEVADVQARDSTFAVVTFTSRQAAIAARKCLSDGRGAGRWRTLEEVPTPPLADASAFNICDFRGCMRPVTVTLNEQQKATRKYLTLGMVGFIYIFYTYPITWAATYGSSNATQFFGGDPRFTSKQVYGFIRALLLNFFLTACPEMFLSLANFGSNATSMVDAEYAALQYYWWFMVLFALLSSSFFQMTIQSLEGGSLQFIPNFQKIAKTIPSEVSATWTNWIIIKFTIFHPLFYLLQFHAILFSCFGMRCCARIVRGGGAGNKMPYRFYVESGVVLMCVLALAPAAPILSPFAVMYFLVCTPLLRYVVIFTYKPQWDAGGIRWPFLSDMIISSLLASQLLLTTMMGMKRAAGPAALAALLCVPTIIFRQNCRKRYLAAYKDAALMQTSLLDGWDTNEKSSIEQRKEFRRFLVDAHKASYVPACIAGANTNSIITAEPAVVIAAPNDVDGDGAPVIDFTREETDLPQVEKADPQRARSQGKESSERQGGILNDHQAGAVMRRGSVLTFAKPPAASAQSQRTGSKEHTNHTCSTMNSAGNSNFSTTSLRFNRGETTAKKDY